MYCTDAATGETRFELTKPASAREVFLECFSPRKKFRVPMVRERSRWTARVALPSGWFFYRFHVDGQPRWDRDAGKMSTNDGGRCSLAIIHHSHPAPAGRLGGLQLQSRAAARHTDHLVTT